jgi:hypothetical protein
MLDISVNELGTFKAHETVFAWLAWQARAELADSDIASEQARIMENAKKKGWAMKNEDPFEDYVQEIIEMRR